MGVEDPSTYWPALLGYPGRAVDSGWRSRPAVWAAGGLALAIVLAGLGVGLLAGRLQPSRTAAAPPAARAQASDVAPAPAATDSPAPDSSWRPLPPATGSFVPVELVIAKLHVQAPVEIKGIDSHNVMEAPDRGPDVAWYRFTARPGAGTNAVFAGHRDFGQVGAAAVFWRLDELAAGDLVEIVSAQQTEIRYRVTRTWDYQLSGIPMGSVLATDPTDEVTLITCAGAYSHGVGYDHRLVVRAVRVP